MNIAIFDPYLRKFTDGMEKKWAERYEVKMERYYDPDLVRWADVVWFDTCDNNLAVGSSGSIHGQPHEGWDMHSMDLSQKKVICRVIDIEAWYGHHNAVDWNLIDDVIFIAPHIQEIVEKDVTLKRTHFIPCGVDLDKFKFKKRKSGNKVAIVSEKWTSKGLDLILQIALELPDYEFHWLGQWSDYEWTKAYFHDFIKHHDLNFTFYDWVSSVDEFLEDKNYLLHASHKEGFSYAVAEAMAKGIKPVLHRFYGADALWPGMTWSSIEDALNMLTDDDYDSNQYRGYLIDKGYTLDKMMERFQEVIDGKSN